MTTAIIKAKAKLQFTTGNWATLKTNQTAKIISERYGIYKVLINGKTFSVDYKHVDIQA
jgi:hypothetical protein